MTFLQPLAFALLAAVPLVVLLYFLKLKRPERRVPSTLLWRKVLEDLRVNSPFQKLKRSLLLLLQLLILLAAILALARPLFKARDAGDESLIVLLDTSASMQAVEPDGRTRLDQAKAEIGRLADRLARNDEMMVIAFNARADILGRFMRDPRSIRDTLARAHATDCGTDVGPALQLARSLAVARAHPRILLFSDGLFPAPGKIDLPAPVEYRQIGTPRPNVAITALDLRRSPGRDRNRVEMFVSLENMASNAVDGLMTVELDGKPLDAKKVSIAALETLSQVFEASLPQGGTVRVRLDAPDALAADNVAWRVIPPPAARSVLIVGRQSFFVERALKSAPGVICETVTPDAYAPELARGRTAVIWDRVPSPAVAPVNNLYLGCQPALPGLKAGAALDTPDILDWDGSHPVNRFLAFDNLVIASTTALTLPEGATVLLRSTQTPLIALFEAGGALACVTGFDPLKSNWPLLVSFPLFLNNCLETFEDQARQRAAANGVVGRPITVTSPDTAPAIVLPSGERQSMVRLNGDDYTFAGTDRAGLYRIEAGAASRSVAVNLLNRDESRLDPAVTVTIGTQAATALEPDRTIKREYWKWLVIGLAGLLLLEWIVYHRRLWS